jgi:DNA invertase Pin-like site-specific DNA recombinase
MSIINYAPAGRLFGYARVSSTDQDLTIQRERLQAAGCHVVRTEKVSGTSLQGRTELASLLEFLREGDTLVVTRIDRLARSLKDLQDIIHDRHRPQGYRAAYRHVYTSG